MTRLHRLASPLLLALLSLLSPALGRADDAPPPISAPAAEAIAPTRPDPALLAAVQAVPIVDEGRAFLWEISSSRRAHRGRVVLTGSVHLGRPEFYPLPAAVDAAFEAADALVVEADLAGAADPELAAMTLRLGQLPEGQTLSGLLPTRRDELRDALAKYMVPMAVLERLQPVLVGVTLQILEMQWLGWDPELGLDNHFLNRARGRKDIVELESLELQAQILFEMPLDVQVAMLESTLDLAGVGGLVAARIWEAIVAGDGDAIVALGAIEGEGAASPALEAFNQRLLGDRNVGMADRLVEHIKKGQGTWFVIVGALHLPGEDGVLDLLDDRRFLKVRQVAR